MKLFWKNICIYVLPCMAFSVFYILCFNHLEDTVVTNYHIIEMTADDAIPFIPFFVIPYYLWFPFVASSVIILYFHSKKEYVQLCLHLMAGMVIFLLVSALFPNGHVLRPTNLQNTNVFTDLILNIYALDTPTNIVPSLHVYNTIAVYVAISNSALSAKIKWLSPLYFIISLSIILSTLFIKQHSMFDLLTAFILSLIFYPLIYFYPYKKKATPIN